MQRSPSWTWTINNLVRVLHTNASASKPTDDRYSHSARRVPHTDDATQRHRQQPGTHTHRHTHTHTHTHTQTHGRLVKLSLVSAGRVSTNHAAQCQRQHDACHLHTSTVYLLTYLLISRVHRFMHSVTVTSVCSTSMPAAFCRHLVGKTLRNVCHCDSAEMRFVGNSVIIWTFS